MSEASTLNEARVRDIGVFSLFRSSGIPHPPDSRLLTPIHRYHLRRRITPRTVPGSAVSFNFHVFDFPFKRQNRSFIHENILAPMHAAGWRHHDVAPRNVVIDKFGTLRLIDFQPAMQACPYGEDCPDLEFLYIHGLPHLPSAHPLQPQT